MEFKVGDRVVAPSESTERHPRSGAVEEVLSRESSPRYRVRWDNGHETIYTPAAGALPHDSAAERSISGARAA